MGLINHDTTSNYLRELLITYIISTASKLVKKIRMCVQTWWILLHNCVFSLLKLAFQKDVLKVNSFLRHRENRGTWKRFVFPFWQVSVTFWYLVLRHRLRIRWVPNSNFSYLKDAYAISLNTTNWGNTGFLFNFNHFKSQKVSLCKGGL